MDKATAMNLLKNTFVEHTLLDGTTVKMTLAFAVLKMLESKNPELADRYYKVTMKNERDMREMDMITIVYTAYVCANIDNPDVLDEETFMILLGSDRFALRDTVQRMLGAKKNQTFAKHS